MSEFFTIRELNPLRTPIPAGVFINLQSLTAHVLDPLRRALNEPLILISAWRPRAYNQEVGGERNSPHIFGQAADFVLSPLVYGVQPSQMILNQIMKHEIEFDQLILHHQYTHISYYAGYNRMEVIDKRVL